MDVNREKAIDLAVSQIERQFGKGSIMKMGEGRVANDLPVVSTGSLGLDIALGVGGLPRGRVVEIYGPESSGKTTLALQVVAEAQKSWAAWPPSSMPSTRSTRLRRKLGVKVDDLLISQPDTGEQALEIADMLVRSGRGRRHRDRLGGRARAQGRNRRRDGRPPYGPAGAAHVQALRKLTGNIKRSNTLVIFINQIRMKIGVMFGNPETTTGGNALKFYASVRLDIRRIGAIKDGEDRRRATRVKVVKNKSRRRSGRQNSTFCTARASPAKARSSISAARWASSRKAAHGTPIGGERIGQGREAAKQFMKEHPATAAQINGQSHGKVRAEES